ncbi:WhiB family transcriptional regulator [Streptomyces vinaceus]|uniref:WhiB family transcriptional regulator n=1 Tax=Streptomyces vinaceus TaxID=1960 RepID=UPI003694E2D6
MPPMSARPIVPSFVRSTDQIGVLPCAEPGVDPDEIFFNPYSTRTAADTALLMCKRCPVRADCRSFAREAREWGFWGGEAESDREPPRRKTQPRRRRAA